MNNHRNYRCFKSTISSRHIFYTVLIPVLLNFTCVGMVKGTQTVKSPDGKVVITFDTKEAGGKKGCLVYSVHIKASP